MLKALQTVHSIRPATTDLAARLGLTVFVRGPLLDQADALQELFSRLWAGLAGRPPGYVRAGSSPSWRRLPDADHAPVIAELIGSTVAGWVLELAEHGTAEADATGAWWQFAELPAVRGLERASYIRVLLASDTPPAMLAALGEWCVQRLKLWWGSAGLVFHYTRGSPVTAHRRMAALAKRYWGVQIVDTAALQWEALRGMPGVNWLTLIGAEFARTGGLTADAIETAALAEVDHAVFHKRGCFGIALAAGAGPVSGDINVGEDLSAYVCLAQLIEPLLLVQHAPLIGPFARREVLSAWLGRFGDPQTWLECDITAN